METFAVTFVMKSGVEITFDKVEEFEWKNSPQNEIKYFNMKRVEPWDKGHIYIRLDEVAAIYRSECPSLA